MTETKYKTYKEMTDADLQDALDSARSQLVTMKFDHATKGLENPLKIREVRRNIARMLTEINFRKNNA